MHPTNMIPPGNRITQEPTSLDHARLTIGYLEDQLAIAVELMKARAARISELEASLPRTADGVTVTPGAIVYMPASPACCIAVVKSVSRDGYKIEGRNWSEYLKSGQGYSSAEAAIARRRSPSKPKRKGQQIGDTR